MKISEQVVRYYALKRIAGLKSVLILVMVAVGIPGIGITARLRTVPRDFEGILFCNYARVKTDKPYYRLYSGHGPRARVVGRIRAGAPVYVGDTANREQWDMVFYGGRCRETFPPGLPVELVTRCRYA